MFTLTRPLFQPKGAKLVRWISLLLISGMMLFATYSVSQLYETRQVRDEANSIATSQETLRHLAIANYQLLQEKIKVAKELGIDTTESSRVLEQAYKKIFKEKDYFQASLLLQAQLAKLSPLIEQKNQELAAEKLKGVLSGTVKEGATLLPGVKISLQENAAEVAATTTTDAGNYSLSFKAGTYTIIASKSGYNTVTKKSVVINAQQTTTLDFSMTKVAPKTTSTAPSSGSTTNGDSQYQLVTVLGHPVHLSTFNLASGQFRVITDTANDNDCLDNCPVKSLSSYVTGNGGFAGMNGTYFCPADYASCAGSVGSFFWKVFNTRLNKMINTNSGNGENDPFIGFNAAGTARYFSSYNSYLGSGFAITAGINHRPALVVGGNNVLNPDTLDDKQRTVKSNRGAIGLKGQTLYLAIAKSATIVDLAAVMDELGVDYAMNLDGGGSSAMIFNGAYKIGPGRSIPNAIIVARR